VEDWYRIATILLQNMFVIVFVKTNSKLSDNVKVVVARVFPKLLSGKGLKMDHPRLLNVSSNVNAMLVSRGFAASAELLEDPNGKWNYERFAVLVLLSLLSHCLIKEGCSHFRGPSKRRCHCDLEL
jgi:hypothetical protein